MASDNLMDQAEIEKLLGQSQSAKPGGAAETPPPEAEKAAPAGEPLGGDDIASIIAGSGAAAASKPAPAAASPDDDKLLAQDDIEKLLSQAGKPQAAGTPPPAAAPPQEAAAAATRSEGEVMPGDVELLLRKAEEALASIAEGSARDMPAGVHEFQFEEFRGAPPSAEAATFDLIRDVELDLKIELGRTHMYLEDVLKLRRGSVVPLDKLAGDPVDIYVNGRLIARGEVLVLNDNFCVRVAELIQGTHVLA